MCCRAAGGAGFIVTAPAGPYAPVSGAGSGAATLRTGTTPSSRAKPGPTVSLSREKSFFLAINNEILIFDKRYFSGK